jgi:hypothetical protein
VDATWCCLVEQKYALRNYRMVPLERNPDHLFPFGHIKAHLWLFRQIQISLDPTTPPWSPLLPYSINQYLLDVLNDLHRLHVQVHAIIVLDYHKSLCLQTWRIYRHYIHPISIMLPALHRVNHTRQSRRGPRHTVANQDRQAYQWKLKLPSKRTPVERVGLDRL